MEKLLNEAGLSEVSVQVELKTTLVKHLGPNEEICTDCGGSGMTVGYNIFGIKGVKASDPFPFKKEALKFCHSCYNGVRKRCEHCKELVSKGWTKCQCQRDIEAKQKADEHWEKVPKISLEEALKTYSMLYVDEYSEYVDSSDFYDWIERQKDEDEDGDFDIKELRIFVTSEHSLQLDAADIIEQACEDLHEDAGVPDKQTKELQTFLNEWCKKNEMYTKTYFADESIGVVCE